MAVLAASRRRPAACPADGRATAVGGRGAAESRTHGTARDPIRAVRNEPLRPIHGSRVNRGAMAAEGRDAPRQTLQPRVRQGNLLSWMSR